MKNVIEYGGRKYREVRRKANVGELVKITYSKDFAKDTITKVVEVDGMYDDGSVTVEERGNSHAEGYVDGSKDKYVVLEPVEEPTPQLAGIHDSLATLALEITELKRKVDANTEDIAFLDEKRLAFESLTPLQLAILNAKDTPADVKLALIVEAGRLEEQRKEIVKEAE
jgi:hypothetical protein